MTVARSEILGLPSTLIIVADKKSCGKWMPWARLNLRRQAQEAACQNW